MNTQVDSIPNIERFLELYLAVSRPCAIGRPYFDELFYKFLNETEPNCLTKNIEKENIDLFFDLAFVAIMGQDCTGLQSEIIKRDGDVAYMVYTNTMPEFKAKKIKEKYTNDVIIEMNNFVNYIKKNQSKQSEGIHR